MVGYAMWVVKRPQYLHKANKSSVQAIYREVFHRLFHGHTYLQQV